MTESKTLQATFNKNKGACLADERPQSSVGILYGAEEMRFPWVDQTKEQLEAFKSRGH
jgi:hypothetical protein